MLKKIRTTLAAITFILVTLLFLDVTGALRGWLHVLARIQFLPAILAMNFVVVAVLILLTLVFGRIYCSVICPLGVMQDIITWLGGKRKRNRFSYSPAKNWLRYSMLGIFVVSMIAGINIAVSLLAPYSSYGRIATNILRPIYVTVNNILASVAEHYNSYSFYSVDTWIKSGTSLAIAVITLLTIAYFAWHYGRTYCNTVCPVGTVLGFISRFSWLKVHIKEDRCVSCGLCARNCKASAIDAENHKIDYSRCVVCGDCLGKCSTKALVYTHLSKRMPVSQADSVPAEKKTQPEDLSRRSFLLATAVATTAAALAQKKKKVDGGLAVIEDKVSPERLTAITPPGSLSAKHMSHHCTACQLCVSACPNGVLRPSTELSNLMQPIMSYEYGYCRSECTECGKVCPTGAIKPIKVEDKSAVQTGHAVWVRKNCIPLTDGVECGNCARHCPTGAIIMVPSDPDDDESVMIPAVNETRCIGCGACENLCPARPFSAIYVEGHETHKYI